MCLAVSDLEFTADKLLVGLAVTRFERGWGRPCSVRSIGGGVGLQAGGELIDAVILLRDRSAVAEIIGRLLPLMHSTDPLTVTSGNGNLCYSGAASAAIGIGPGVGICGCVKVHPIRGKNAISGVSLFRLVVRVEMSVSVFLYVAEHLLASL